MGWQDRQYASPPPRSGLEGMYSSYARRPRSMVTTLIVINVAIYILCSMSTPSRGPLSGEIFGSPLFQFGFMETGLVLKGQVWRIVTSDYLHWGIWHIFLNMLGLHFLGRPLEQLWGPRKFFGVYTVAGIIASLFYMALNLAGWLPSGPAAGASGCVLALLGAGAVLFPRAELLIYGIFPVKMRTAAIVLSAAYAFNIFQKGGNAGGDACHLAGLAFGVWWSLQGDAWWFRWRRNVRNPGIAGGSGFAGRPRTPSTSGFRERMKQRRDDAQLVDRLLDKIHDRGITSLTEREKRELADATARQQFEEKQQGRPDRI